MHSAFVLLALVDLATAADQAVSLLHLNRQAQKLSAGAGTAESLSRADAAVMALVEKTASEGYQLTAADQEAIDAIKALVQQIIDHAASETGHDQNALDALVTIVTNCGTTASSELSTSAAELGSTAGTARGVHADCRENEAEKKILLTEKCADYDNHRLVHHAPSCVSSLVWPATSSTGADQSTMESCAVLVDSWASAFVPFMDECTNAVDIHAPIRSACAGHQTIFEEDYCGWKEKIDDICDEQDNCRGGVDLTGESGAVAASVTSRKADHNAAKRILCILAVFESPDGNRAGILSACKDATYDTTHLDIAPRTAPDAFPCTKKTDFPCTNDWTLDEYNSKGWWVNANTETCQACPA